MNSFYFGACNRISSGYYIVSAGQVPASEPSQVPAPPAKVFLLELAVFVGHGESQNHVSARHALSYQRGNLRSCITRRISSHSPGETSIAWCSATRLRHASGSDCSISEIAAAARAGERLIPAPQHTSVGVVARSRAVTALIARPSVSRSLPAPSSKGKRQ
jgi:hypothetical protein